MMRHANPVNRERTYLRLTAVAVAAQALAIVTILVIVGIH